MKKGVIIGLILFLSLSFIVAQTCTDSDGGNNLPVRGVACIGGECQEDLCQNDGRFIEYYCSPDGLSILATNFSECPYDLNCVEGACIEDIVTLICGDRTCDAGETCSNCKIDCGICSQDSETCTDSDGGYDYFNKGTLEWYINGVKSTNTDYCMGSSLTEYVCVNEKSFSEVYNCLNGCSNGACVGLSDNTTCTDSDGGYDYFNKGIVKFYVDGTLYSNPDTCSGNWINEYGCVEEKSVSKTYECPGLCEDGRCLNMETFLEDVSCEPLSVNTEGDDKINILFIPDNFEQFNFDYFKEALLEQIEGTFYSIEPFKGNRDVFNFYIINSTTPFFQGEEFSDLSLGDPTKVKAKAYAELCSHDINQYIIVIDDNRQVRATIGEGLALSTIQLNTGALATIHEFGHSFGGLLDTYYPFVRHDGTSSLVLNYNLAPNIDEGGCPKWCESNTGVYETDCTKIINETECRNYNRIPNEYGGQCKDEANCCVWLNNEVDPFFNSKCVNLVGHKNIGVNCLEGTGCYYGTYYPGDWRPTDAYNTIMMGGGNEYDPVSVRALELKIKCCYPQGCEDFPSECKEYSEKYLNAFGSCGVCKDGDEELEVIEVEDGEECTTGCYLDGKCYNIGYRKGLIYCNQNMNFTQQKRGYASCEDNSECLSNICIEDNCVQEGVWKRFRSWFRRAFRRGRV